MDDDQPKDLKQCKQCAELIPNRARLCNHCKSYQNWLGYVNVSSTVLALLIALVSVSTAAIPLIKNAIIEPKSRLTVVSPIFHGESVSVIAANLGDKAGAVKRAELSSAYLDGQVELNLRSAREAFVDTGAKQVNFDIVVSKNTEDTALLTLGVTPAILSKRQEVVGAFVVWFEQSNGSEQSTSFPVRRADLMTLLEAHWRRCSQLGNAPTWESGCKSLRDLQRETDDHVRKTLKRLRTSRSR